MINMLFGVLTLGALPFDEELASVKLPATAEVEVTGVIISAIEQINIPGTQNGVISRIAAEEGDRVSKGEMLAEIDARDAELAHRQATIEYESAMAIADSTLDIELAAKELKIAESELRRANQSRKLYAGTISDEELDQKRLVVDRAQLKLSQAKETQQQRKHEAALAEVKLKMMDLVLSRHRIVSPVDGVVAELKQRRGEWMEAGQPLVRLVRTDKLKAQGMTDGSNLPLLKRGQLVRVTVVSATATSKEFRGRLKFISPEIVAVDGRLSVWAEVDNANFDLYPGTRATMTIDLKEASQKSKAPTQQ